MILSRRTVLAGAGGVLLAPAQGAEIVEIVMTGRTDGSAVWFDPVGVAVMPGTTIRWVNRDPGNSHTATAWPDRIPRDAEPWDSGYLLPDESFAVTLTAEGVYDYYCIPHAAAGMAGRIVVGRRELAGQDGPLPTVADILRRGRIAGGASR